ncbi:MAG TPA: hypothetical protein VHY82_16035 [Acetobacteraceae bacterium]|jgi:hypothetical protein|nr:hypothetical protein [Acetobacteraceae bacterium]
MLIASATDLAIALAHRNGTLRMTEHKSRFGGTFIVLADECGVIETADDMAAAERRVQEITQ